MMMNTVDLERSGQDLSVSIDVSRDVCTLHPVVERVAMDTRDVLSCVLCGVHNQPRSSDKKPTTIDLVYGFRLQIS